MRVPCKNDPVAIYYFDTDGVYIPLYNACNVLKWSWWYIYRYFDFHIRSNDSVSLLYKFQNKNFKLI